MGCNIKFHNPEGVCFVSFAVVEWSDVSSRGSREIVQQRKRGNRVPQQPNIKSFR